MTAHRPQVRMVLMVLASFLLLLLRAEDVTTSGYQDSLPVAGLDARQNVNTEASSGDRRQSRMSSHMELPSSKAKREQALRSLLAERRRQILNQRSSESSYFPNRTPRPVESPSKDSTDVLEAQETRHGIYVTASVGSPTDDHVEEGTGSQDRKNEEDQPEIKTIAEEPTASGRLENFTTSITDSSTNSARNHHVQRNSTVSSAGNSPIAPLTAQKNSEMDCRKKNTFVMPESLYNHFRPVESNIPVEDMSQFLYFGQKLNPGIQNTTGNNSVEVTPTVPTLPSSRRRYSMKRYTTTTTTTMSVPKLEDIMNEEMNIAVERQTVEKNTVSKIKNAFRSAGSSIYYRKARPMDSTIASNVIPANESGRNTTDNEGRTEMGTRDDKSRDNPSAHAKDQLHGAEQRGSAAHVHDETWNATDSTQISSERRRLSANTHGQDKKDESSAAKSEIRDLELGISVTSANKSTPLPAAQTSDRKTSQTAQGDEQRSKTKDSSILLEISPAETGRSDNQKKRDAQNSTVTSEARNSTQIADPDIEDFRSKDDTIVVDRTNDDGPELLSMDTISTDGQHDFSTSRESNNIESSTANDKTYTSLDRSTWTTSNPEESSSLRIVVTEINVGGDSTTVGFESAQGNTVKPVYSTEKRVIPVSSVGLGSLKRARTTMGSSVVSEGVGETVTGAPVASAISPMQQQAQHVYAYTITNVTRLLRNYTGPGLSREEQGGPYRSTGTAGRAEITSRGAGQYTESTQRQQQQHHQQEPQEQQEPPAQSPLLPRAGSIDSERSPAELSTGTTVVEARTTVASLPSSIAAGTTLVGERPRKVAPATQHSQRALNRPIHLHPPPVNKTVAPARSRLPEASQRGSVRWNHTKSRIADFDGANDRRFLRKSASAVLNQRIGSSADEDPLNLNNKRRRVQGIFYPSQNIHRRVKGFTTVKSVEGPVNENAPRGLGLNDSVTGDRRNSVNGKKENDVSAGSLGIMHLDRVNNSENFDGEVPFVSSMETSVDHSFVLSGEKVQDERMNATTMTTNEGNVGEGVVEFDTKDESGASKNEIKFGVPRDQSVTMAAVSGDGENVEQGNGSAGGSATERPKESDAYKETVPTTTTTTVTKPIFPVTPRILPDPSNLGSKETFTLTPTEPLNQGTEKPAELDPSEIQKLYRSNSSSTTETPSTTTTMIPTTIGAESQSVRQPVTGVPVGPVYRKPESSTASPSVEIRKETSGERSPEVRGRNLSDKTKDKDNVLPIMRLYNTSRIFNGSESMGEGPLEGDSPRVVVPIDDEIVEDTRTTTAATTTTTRRRPSAEDRLNSSRVPVDESKETASSTQSSAKRDRQEENREVHSSHESSNGPTRVAGHGHSSGNPGRTKHHRPSPSPPPAVYHQTILPEYNGSVYPNEMNRTFFEAGLISAGPRDMVNISEVISKRHDSDAIASQETVAVVSYILATLVVFPIAVGVGLILRRLIIRNRKVLEESDTSSEISCRKDALNLENGDFKTSIEKAITKLPRIQHLCHEAEKPPPPPTQESRWEFPRDKLRLQTVLGQGNFGQVWKAEADDLTGHQGTTRLVAVKTVKEGASDREKEDLVRELEIMQQLGSHPNVVTLLGCCTEEEPHYLILEYVMYGKLLAYLRDHRTRQDFYNFSEDSAALTSRDLTVFGYCVARGMEYLASKKIIHRDLAARNVLVDHNKLCKIADFGMSRFANEDGEVIETRRERNALPIRWMAPESLIYSLFTTKTDVWSFGILMWEIVTLGSTPYPDMTAREVMCNVQNGYRLERPSHCRSELFRVISRCWHAVPDRRPEFQTLRRDLAQLLEDNMNGHYVDLESFASECTD